MIELLESVEQRRAKITKSGCLFEGVGQLHDFKIVLVATDDLNADGQALAGESGGYGNRWMSGDCDVVAGLHPVDVRFHRLIVDGCDVR